MELEQIRFKLAHFGFIPIKEDRQQLLYEHNLSVCLLVSAEGKQIRVKGDGLCIYFDAADAEIYYMPLGYMSEKSGSLLLPAKVKDLEYNVKHLKGRIQELTDELDKAYAEGN
jgi:hypothetical protein